MLTLALLSLLGVIGHSLSAALSRVALALLALALDRLVRWIQSAGASPELDASLHLTTVTLLSHDVVRFLLWAAFPHGDVVAS